MEKDIIQMSYRTWKVKSDTHPNKWYYTWRDKNGDWHCSCLGQSINMDSICKHIKKVRIFIKKTINERGETL